jgi:hypothetical protein
LCLASFLRILCASSIASCHSSVHLLLSSCCASAFSYAFSVILLSCLCRSPVVLLSFSYCSPVVLLLFSCCFSVILLSFLCVFPAHRLRLALQRAEVLLRKTLFCPTLKPIRASPIHLCEHGAF